MSDDSRQKRQRPADLSDSNLNTHIEKRKRSDSVDNVATEGSFSFFCFIFCFLFSPDLFSCSRFDLCRVLICFVCFFFFEPLIWSEDMRNLLISNCKF